MNILTKKQAILQALDSMNECETERVVQFIKDLLYNEALDYNYQTFKQRAMVEIKEALQGNDRLAV